MKRRFYHIILKLFIPYYMIVIAFFSVIMMSYSYMGEELRKEEYNLQEESLKQIQLFLDKNFSEVNNMNFQLLQMNEVTSFRRYSREQLEKDYKPAIRLYQKLQDLKPVSDFIQNYYIFYENSNYAVSPGCIQRMDGLFLYTLKIEGQQVAKIEKQLYSKFYDRYCMEAFHGFIKSEQIYTMPVLSTVGSTKNDHSAVIVTFLNMTTFRNFIEGYEKIRSGNIVIVNDQNKILYSATDESLVGHPFENKRYSEKYMVMHKESEQMEGYRYYLIQRQDAVYTKISALRTISIIVIIGLLVLVIAGLFFSIRENGKPIVNLLNENSEMEEKINQQRNNLVHIFLERWLKGGVYTKEQLIINAKALQEKYIGEYYGVIVCRFDVETEIQNSEYIKEDLTQFEESKILCMDCLQRHGINSKTNIQDWDYNKIVGVYIDTQKDETKAVESLQMVAEGCLEELSSMEGITVTICISCMVPEIDKVSECLTSCLFELDHTEISRNEVIACRKLQKDLSFYYYPSDIEEKLFQCTCSGNQEMVEALLRDILTQNIMVNNLSTGMMKILIYELWGTFNKCIRWIENIPEDLNLQINEVRERFEQIADTEKVRYCKKFFLILANYVANEKNNHKRDIMEEINAFVLEHCFELDFGLSYVADQFELSTAYLSQIYKTYNNENFYDRIQKIRMEKAMNLLNNSSMKIKDIVIACGYSSNNTFGKAFKRIYGVSASEYRETQKTKNIK